MKIVHAIAALWLACAATPFASAQSLGWRQLPGGANDIGVDPTGGVWIIGTDLSQNNYGIYRLNPNRDGWEKIPGGAVRIDVGPEGPWVVNAAGGIYRYNGRSWDQFPGSARDIGVGAKGTVWVIGNNVEPGGYDIYRFNGRGWDKIPGAALRIDVDPKGNAWVVNSYKDIYRYDGSKFVHVPGKAVDIGIGANGAVYIVGTDGGVYHLAGTQWVKYDGILTEISADEWGRAWGVNPGKQIFTTSVGLKESVPPPPPPPPPTNLPFSAPLDRPQPPGPPGPESDQILMVNDTPRHVWVTLYKIRVPKIDTPILVSHCVPPWGYAYLKGDFIGRVTHEVRAEMTSTEKCAPLPNNRHVVCDTRSEAAVASSYRVGYSKATLKASPEKCWWENTTPRY